MRVVIDNIGFSLQRMGGLSVVWGTLLNALKGSDIQYECMEYPGGMENKIRKNLSGLNVKQYHPALLQVERYLDLKVSLDEPFIFHSSHYRICNNPKAVNITTVHDFTYERYRKGLAKWIHSWQKFKAIRKADVVVCISENTKKDVLHYVPNVSEDKIRIIYNGVSTDYKPVECTSYKNLGEYVIFVGSRDSYKNFDLVVEALAKTPYKLAIVGRGLNDKERAYVEEKLGDNYICMGYLSNCQLNELFNQAVCLAYPSSYEGFGIPVLEAQRAGCPVIAFNSSSIPEVIGNTPLLMNNLTIQEFIDKLELLKDSAVRKNVIDEGLKNSQRFSWEKMGAEYLSLYKELGA